MEKTVLGFGLRVLGLLEEYMIVDPQMKLRELRSPML